MPRRRPRTIYGVTTTVKFTDQATGKSLSFTVYGADYKSVAEYAQGRLSAHWTATKLTDKRHKRR